MARRPAPPSPSPARPAEAAKGAPRTPRRERGADARRVDVREWTSGIRLSAFSVIMLSLVVLGTWVLVPTIGTYLSQKQKIAAVQASVQVTKEQIAALQLERERWNDPAYISTQARERLYYVKPGSVPFLVDNDLDPAALPKEPEPVSDEIVERKNDWMPQLLRSITASGLAKNAVEAPAR